MRLNNYCKTIISHESPLKFLLSRLLIRLKISHFFLISRAGYRIRFYPSAYSTRLWINNKTKIPTLDFIHDYLREGDYFIDVGANIGIITIEASIIVGSKGKIFSIEPHPKVFSFLKDNISLNHFINIETFNVALGDREGEILFSNIKSDDQNSIIDVGDGFSVPICRLDSIITMPKITLLKIDVEGYEKFVLLGATKLLKNIDCVYFEALERGMQKYNYSIKDVYDILLDNGFQLFRIINQREILQITDTYKPQNVSGEDLLAIKNIDDFFKRTRYEHKTRTKDTWD